jgi:hypothetical protein
VLLSRKLLKSKRLTFFIVRQFAFHRIAIAVNGCTRRTSFLVGFVVSDFAIVFGFILRLAIRIIITRSFSDVAFPVLVRRFPRFTTSVQIWLIHRHLLMCCRCGAITPIPLYMARVIAI